MGLPKPSDFKLTHDPIQPPADGEALVEVLYVSLDPYMRGRMNDAKSYAAAMSLGEVVGAIALGRVLESRSDRFGRGDIVRGYFGLQSHATADARWMEKVDPAVAPLTVHLAALGMTGQTAYFGMLDVGAIKPGETVVVSGAAGATGMVAGQIAKIKGCRVIGIAGGPEKCAYITGELGFDGAVDYKAGDPGARLGALCPDGLDVFFDNVGGAILDACLVRLRYGGRVVLCGGISQYNNTGAMHGPGAYLSLLGTHGRMEGFIVSQYASRFPEAQEQLRRWLDEGKLKSREDIVEGLENFPDAFLRLFDGRNMGKLMLKVNHP